MSNVKLRIYTAAMNMFNAAPQKTVTPTQLTAALGADAPASKHAWFLKSMGFSVQANKDGRNVVSYTMLAAPATAPAAPAPKAVKQAKVKTPKAPVAPKAKAQAPAAVAKAAAKKSPTAKKAKAAPAMTDADLQAAAASVDIADVNELDDRSDLPDFLR